MNQPSKPKKLLDQYRDRIRLKQYSPRTEKTYVQWVRAYILFHNKRHPREMGVAEIDQFITHLVVDRKASASTQNQALSAILFLYRNLLNIQLDEIALNFVRPKKGSGFGNMSFLRQPYLLIPKPERPAATIFMKLHCSDLSATPSNLRR